MQLSNAFFMTQFTVMWIALHLCIVCDWLIHDVINTFMQVRPRVNKCITALVLSLANAVSTRFCCTRNDLQEHLAEHRFKHMTVTTSITSSTEGGFAEI